MPTVIPPPPLLFRYPAEHSRRSRPRRNRPPSRRSRPPSRRSRPLNRRSRPLSRRSRPPNRRSRPPNRRSRPPNRRQHNVHMLGMITMQAIATEHTHIRILAQNATRLKLCPAMIRVPLMSRKPLQLHAPLVAIRFTNAGYVDMKNGEMKPLQPDIILRTVHALYAAQLIPTISLRLRPQPPLNPIPVLMGPIDRRSNNS